MVQKVKQRDRLAAIFGVEIGMKIHFTVVCFIIMSLFLHAYDFFSFAWYETIVVSKCENTLSVFVWVQLNLLDKDLMWVS